MGNFKPTPGVCRECGCTETNACQGGCAWADATMTICTACAPCPDCGLGICECDEHEGPK